MTYNEGKLTYAGKLKDPNWQKKRLEILNRDNFSCKECGDTKTELHVHHFRYEKNKEPWEYPNENFITLCKHCHTVVEGLTKAECLPISIKKDIFSEGSNDYYLLTALYYSIQLDKKFITFYKWSVEIGFSNVGIAIDADIVDFAYDGINKEELISKYIK